MARFVRNPTFDREIQAEPDFVKGMRSVATHVTLTAKEIAPDKTGYYKRRLVAVGTNVWSRDPFGHLVEAGSVNNPPYAPLRRAVRAAGLRLIEEPKK